jgi:DNA recombination-dependent growth factor C
LPKKESEMLPAPLEKDILKAQLHEPEPTELPKVAKREITQISEEQLNE